MIGRTEELKSLDVDLSREEPQLVVVYGRRRIGKTYLIREKFADQFTFFHTGVRGGLLEDQLEAFRASLVQYGYRRCPRLKGWIDAFCRLDELIARAPDGRKIAKVVQTAVVIKHLDEADIQALLASGEWQGVAGYRIEGVLSACVTKIIGSHPNIIGLPIFEVAQVLKGVLRHS